MSIYLSTRDSIDHHLLEVICETATVPELRQKLLYATPSGWWWCKESVFHICVYIYIIIHIYIYIHNNTTTNNNNNSGARRARRR